MCSRTPSSRRWSWSSQSGLVSGPAPRCASMRSWWALRQWALTCGGEKLVKQLRPTRKAQTDKKRKGWADTLNCLNLGQQCMLLTISGWSQTYSNQPTNQLTPKLPHQNTICTHYSDNTTQFNSPWLSLDFRRFSDVFLHKKMQEVPNFQLVVHVDRSALGRQHLRLVHYLG